LITLKIVLLFQNGKTRFIDTMSFHIAVAGFTSHQRLLYNAAKSGGSGERKELTEMKERLEGARIEVCTIII
jgi:hypothetical protein